MQSLSACILAALVLLTVGLPVFEDNENTFYVPLTGLERRMVRRSVLDEMNKRAFNQHQQLAIPRGGAMVSGRGWMPGFVDTPRFLYKRSL
ncbi:unnamed protein product [Caenorhabditis angaria]|uniref:Neuropeptide-Like Protein n=1 Tax=Caenorhabditis angaria TaxID=860376 RepID=A0A9P1J219_9PELO|nr:unnamed protein product [Caenorhabditis angaria]